MVIYSLIVTCLLKGKCYSVQNNCTRFINSSQFCTVHQRGSTWYHNKYVLGDKMYFLYHGSVYKNDKTDLFCTIALSFSVKLHSFFTVFWQERGLPVLYSTDQPSSPKHCLHTQLGRHQRRSLLRHTLYLFIEQIILLWTEFCIHITTEVPILNWVMEQGSLTQNRSNLHRQFAFLIHISRVRFGWTTFSLHQQCSLISISSNLYQHDLLFLTVQVYST